MKASSVRRINPEFPKWQTPKTGAGFLFGIFLWIILFLVFVFMLYASWFTYNLKYFLVLIRPRHYEIPVWFSVLCSIFFFPFTLLVIVLGTLGRIFRGA